MKDVDHSIVILNRVVTWTDKGIELEADPKHVALLIQEVGCEGSKVFTPLVKERFEETLNIFELRSIIRGTSNYVQVSKYEIGIPISR